MGGDDALRDCEPQAGPVPDILRREERFEDAPLKVRGDSRSIVPDRHGDDVDAVKRVVQRLRDAGYLHIVEENVEIPDVEAVTELVSLLEVKDQLAGGSAKRKAGAS